MSEWKEYKLGELCEITSAKRIFYSEYTKSGVPFYRSKEIIDLFNKRNISTELYISNDRYNEISSKFGVPHENDILLTSVGSLGIPYLIRRTDKFYFKDGNLTWFRNIDKTKIDSMYLLHWLCSAIGIQKLDEVTIGSTQPALTITGLKTIDILLPPLSEQKQIAGILSSLDDKIDLLNRENKTLEAMAETLFRKWFVEETKEDWKEGKLGDLIVVKYGKDHKNLQNGNIPVFGSGGIMRHVNKHLYDKESVLIPRKGSLNNVMYMNGPFWTVDTMFYTEMKQANVAKFVYHYLKNQDLSSMNVGSAVPSMTVDVLKNMPIKIPGQGVFDNFEEQVSSLYLKIRSNQIYVYTLCQLCDTLLTKLMDGDLNKI